MAAQHSLDGPYMFQAKEKAHEGPEGTGFDRVAIPLRPGMPLWRVGVDARKEFGAVTVGFSD